MNTWTHVAVTRSATGVVKHYINGVFNSTGNQTVPSGPVTGENIFTISRKDAQWFDGLIDDLGVVAREMSDTEILSAYNKSNNGISIASNSGANGQLSDKIDMQGIATVNGTISAKGALEASITGTTTLTYNG